MKRILSFIAGIMLIQSSQPAKSYNTYKIYDIKAEIR